MKENKNLIGISGRKRNGKDLSIELINEILTENNKPQYERKAFAGKLKEIATMLTGVTGWETEEDKAKELGPEWSYWAIKEVWYVIKGNIITKDISYEQVKSGVYKSEQDAWNKIYEDVTTNEFRKKLPVFIPMTRRVFLQKLGSDACNQNVHSNIWINSLFADYVPSIKSQGVPIGNGEFSSTKVVGTYVYPNWMICDVRFPQEVDAVKEKGGKVIRVIRPDKYDHGDQHISETALDNYNDFDFVVYNDGTIADLKDKLKNVLLELGLI